jgi:hypothetical protein
MVETNQCLVIYRQMHAFPMHVPIFIWRMHDAVHRKGSHVAPPLLLDDALLDELLLDELLLDELLLDDDALDELLDEPLPLDELLDEPSPLDELPDEPFPLDELTLIVVAPPLPFVTPPAPPSPPRPSPSSPKPGPVGVAHAPTNPSTNAAKPSFLVLMPASAHVNVSARIFTQFIQESKDFLLLRRGFPEQSTQRVLHHDERIETKQG